MDEKKISCDVMADLLTLYADDLCSESSKALVEEHIANCDECKSKLENYKTEIGVEIKREKEDVTPLKKVNKKLRRRKVTAIILAVILGIILICLGILCYGEATNKFVSFTSLSDMAELKKITKEFCSGNSAPLIDIIASNVDDYYDMRNSGFEDYEDYKSHLKTVADKIYEEAINGSKYEIKLTEFYFEPYEDKLAYLTNIGSTYYVYDITDENGDLLVQLLFNKIKGKYYAVDITNGKGQTTFDNFPQDRALIKIALKHSVNKAYEAIMEGTYDKESIPGPALVIRYYKPDEAGFEEYRKTLSEKLYDLYENGLCLKDTMFSVDSFDNENGKWIYKVWFEFENTKNGESVFLESYFHYINYNFYIIKDRPAQIISGDNNLTQEQTGMLTTVFEP